ncbi:MAG: MurR/RpiR family transcriptional regulator [Lachnospiraceae bacterium]|nr:MurR/RpiR family transcriptional regulator [Lachnospiraceae bacterium]
MIEELKEQYGHLSKGHRRIADYVAENAESAAFLTAAKLGEACGVSESTVVRFAMRLGYDGYGDFQKALADEVKDRLIPPKVNQTMRLKEDPSELMRKVLVRDAQNIVDSIHMVSATSFDTAVDLLKEAPHVYILGIRSCAPLAQYFSYYLGLMRKNVISLSSNNVNELFEQLAWLEQGDAVVGISFPRYSLRTLKAMDYANSRGARLITITDSEYSPMNMYSSCNLWVRSDMITLVDSMVAPMSLINSLIVALYMRDQDRINEYLGRMEEIWDNYQTYASDDLSEPGE